MSIISTLTRDAAILAANTAKLPELCYDVHDLTGQPVILKRGETGFYETDWPALHAEAVVASKNAALGVTDAQRQAMKAGSLFGFHIETADPDLYTSEALARRKAARARG